MSDRQPTPPAGGERIEIHDGASRRMYDAAVERACGGKRRIIAHM